MREFGVLDTWFWKTAMNNKYLLYIVALLTLQLLLLFYALDQANIRMHREEKYVDYIEELERNSGINKIRGAPDEPIN